MNLLSTKHVKLKLTLVAVALLKSGLFSNLFRMNKLKWKYISVFGSCRLGQIVYLSKSVSKVVKGIDALILQYHLFKMILYLHSIVKKYHSYKKKKQVSNQILLILTSLQTCWYVFRDFFSATTVCRFLTINENKLIYLGCQGIFMSFWHASKIVLKFWYCDNLTVCTQLCVVIAFFCL